MTSIKCPFACLCAVFMVPPLGNEGDAAAACRTYLSRRKVWEQLKREIAKGKHELTPYSFRNRYAYYGHNRPKEDGSYRAPKRVTDAMVLTLDTRL